MCSHQCLMLQLANLYLVPFIPLLRAYLEVNCKQKQQDLKKMKIWSGSPVPWQIAYLTLFPEKMKKREQMANITHGMGQVSCESSASLSTTLSSLRSYTRSNRTNGGAAACAACCMHYTASLTCRSGEFSLWIANKLVFTL